MYGRPQNMYGQPQKMHEQPQKMYGQPQKMYGQAQKMYGQPHKPRKDEVRTPAARLSAEKGLHGVSRFGACW